MLPVQLSILGSLDELLAGAASGGPGALDAVLGPLREIVAAVASLSAGDGSGGIASAPVVLLAAGTVVFLGVAGEAFFKRTGIPDVAFLMVLGVAIGPVLGIISHDVVIAIVPYFAAVALIIIMFDGGRSLDLRSMARTAHFAFGLALAGFAASTAAVAALAHFGIGWPLLDSVLLGSIVGGSSSAIVFGLVRNIRLSESAKSMLSFESALTDILSTIIAFIMFQAVLTGGLSPEVLSETIGTAVVVGLVLGLGVGIPWMYVTTKLGNAQHAYMLTLGMLFVLFFMANLFGESGALTALVFGLMLGNKASLSRVFRFKVRMIERDDPTHNQLAFLVRAFFFVFVGLLASFGQIEYIVLGIAATVAIFVLRTAVARAVLTSRFSRLDKKVTQVMIPRGLAAAVLATMPLTLGLPNGEAYPQIVFFIILASVVITTVGLGSAKRIPPPEAAEGGFVRGGGGGGGETEGNGARESSSPPGGGFVQGGGEGR